MKDPRVERLAQNILSYSCDVQPGENVVIESFGDHNYDFVKALMREIYRRGASPFLWLRKMDVHREILMQCNEQQLRVMCEVDSLMMSKMDVYIRVRGEENTSEMSDVPPENMAKYAEIYQRPVHSKRSMGSKWCVMHYPTDAMAQAECMSMESLEDYFFEVCCMDYAKMAKAFAPLKALMEKTDRVRLVGGGTDLSFSIKDMPAIPCAGKQNIPDGEIFTAPTPGSINGVICYNTTGFFDGFAFENIRFTFHNGRIIEATANDTARLNKILDRDEGARGIGEFAIGVNPYVTKPMKDSMFNEKMSGSIHFTPGNCYKDCENGNHSSIHWDLVYAQTPEYGGGEMYFDDVLVRKDGKFILPELLGLNPENLK